jgi:phosphatidylinositol glycan class W
LKTRQANLPYVVWVAAFNTTFLGLYLILHLVLDPSGGEEEGEAKAPAIFEAINRNGLVVFLVVSPSRRPFFTFFFVPRATHHA